jgi:anti-sigma B factor antagonist
VAELNGDPVASLLPQESGRPPTIVLRGELDALRADGAKVVVDQALEVGPEMVRFEMGDLTFMDSSGLAVLVHAANHVDKVVLVRPSELISRVIQITGLSEIFEVEP